MRGLSRVILSVAVLAILALGLTGCATAPRDTYPESMPANTAPLPGDRSGVSTAPVESTRPTYAGPWEDPSSPLYERTIYFDYDSAEIKPEYVSLLRTHARYLGTHTDTRVTLEGHTDERGTREYNLALGDQRAETVRRFMLAEGVLPDQMATLSYGEERPSSLGHDEQSWRRNRRVTIQY